MDEVASPPAPVRRAVRVATLLLAIAFSGTTPILPAQTTETVPAGVTTLELTAEQPAELRLWDARLQAMARSGRAIATTTRADTLRAGAVHERFEQYVHGIRVFGGDLVRQTSRGQTESIYGVLHGGVGLDPVSRITEEEAREAFAGMSAAPLAGDLPIELVVLPLDSGRYALAWRAHVWTDEGWMHTFLDAGTGELALQYDDLRTQAAVGTGTGVLGDTKKISARATGGRYVADDRLRPPLLVTYDMRGNLTRTELYLRGLYLPGPSDLASDGDNVWTDRANVDAHVHLGWTYDYYFKRFGRRGLDDRDVPIYGTTHPVRRSDVPFLRGRLFDYAVNAFWCGTCGPGGSGAMVFGEGLPPGYVLTASGQYVDYLAGGLDIVAHELTHGLTEFSSNLVYRSESGALNESFSDVLGTSVEFFYHSGRGGLAADCQIGEDVFRPGGIRSMADPRAFGDPDHYARRFRGPDDNGGVHINSGIPNQAFYLAVEGGVNRTSGRAVQGIGAANRAQIEQAFYRAFVYLLPSSATFSMARAATTQAARELHGAGSPAERALVEAWTAVGVN